MTREQIKEIQEVIVPYFVRILKKINFEGLGKADAEKAEKDLNEVFGLAIKALEQESVIDKIRAEVADYQKEAFYSDDIVMTKRMVLAIIDKHRAEMEKI